MTSAPNSGKRTQEASATVFYLHTLRHIPPRQILRLLRHRVKSLLRSAFPGRICRGIERRSNQEWPATAIHQSATLIADVQISREGAADILSGFRDFQNGKIRLLNREYTFRPGKIWDLDESKQLPPLTRETLHYHHFLTRFSLLLVSEEEETDSHTTGLAGEVLSLIEETLEAWWKRFPPGKERAWDPFTVAFRIQEWLRMHKCLTSPSSPLSSLRKGGEMHERIERSLLEHGLYLERNLEWHLGGNHLLKDLCALTMLAGFFEGPASDRWYSLVSRLLPIEVDRQILPDGGHYERSPMYHALVLKDLLDAADFLRCRDPRWVERNLERPLEKMSVFLEGILHGDGEIPFFNDSVLGQAPSQEMILSRSRKQLPHSAGAESMDSFPDTGFTRVRRAGFSLIMDHGRLGPDELMGHVHNDALSFELSIGRARWIINRGVFEYTTGSLRQECRSISAHNTPSVDDLEQCETWGSFRVARRWHVASSETGRDASGVWWVSGSWTRPGLPSVQRIFYSFPGGTIAILDRFSGSGYHQFRVPLYFAPGVKVEPRGGKSPQEERFFWTWEVECGRNTLFGVNLISAPATLSLSQSVYWPRFYTEEPISRLLLEACCRAPLAVLTVFGREADPVVPPANGDWAQEGVHLRTPEGDFHLVEPMAHAHWEKQ